MRLYERFTCKFLTTKIESKSIQSIYTNCLCCVRVQIYTLSAKVRKDVETGGDVGL